MISLLIKPLQSDQSNPKYYHERNGFYHFIFSIKKSFEKAYFMFKLTSPAMVRPASSDKWKAPLEYFASAA